jgi:hypothetical protein
MGPVGGGVPAHGEFGYPYMPVEITDHSGEHKRMKNGTLFFMLLNPKLIAVFRVVCIAHSAQMLKVSIETSGTIFHDCKTVVCPPFLLVAR